MKVLGDIVGRRPAREGGMRVETEGVSLEVARNRTEEKKRVVVHAYGAGGRGYELSWGVAQEAVGLIEAHLGFAGGAENQPVMSKL